MVEGVVFNIQRYCLDDGPGIRTTVFLKGCYLRCLWCDNPESWNPWPEVAHRDTLCIHCNKCVETCEVKAILVDRDGIRIDRQKCTNCGKCVEKCVSKALRFYGKIMSVDEVFQEVLKDIQYYQFSNGGVTISGGEPLYQPDFTREILKRCRESKIHTCIETSGFGEPNKLKEILEYTSLVYFDIKHSESAAHMELTGKPNDKILRNLELTVATETPVIVRVPFVSRLNSSLENMKAIAEIMTSFKLNKVELLPYHAYGISKYKMLDRNYALSDIKRPLESELKKAKEIFESYGILCEIR
ncbi:MAG: glycyl-radical enzyme activating protein [Nitrososphaerota archaeon]|nr:glycyl-radical enzyme activating protein [Candidatus Bathyarchaeota archaeon]MDW8023211.1 glycyl-radical enzyme activating protein [Nitrososphaerota archaeon]